ncbi:MAG: GNAT family N-acetyltransferase [Ktedonobacterales bacterium]
MGIEPSVTYTTAVSEGDEDAITARLVAYNRAHGPKIAPPQAARPLHVFARAPDGRVVGGLVGRTHAIPYWLEISIVWVDDSYRRQGIGRCLLQTAEHEARVRGCRHARLATSDYQAPGFYARLGYEQYGELADCPPGERVFYLCKPLTSHEARSGVD